MTALEAVSTDLSAIARFSKPKAYAFVFGWLAVCFLFDILILYHPAGTSLRGYLNSKGLYRFSIAMVALALSAFLVVRMLTVLFHLLFRKCLGIWVRGGRVFYVDTYGFGLISSICVDDIESVSAGTIGNSMMAKVVVGLHSGSKVGIAAWLFSEPADTVAVRLDRARVHGAHA